MSENSKFFDSSDDDVYFGEYTIREAKRDIRKCRPKKINKRHTVFNPCLYSSVPGNSKPFQMKEIASQPIEEKVDISSNSSEYLTADQSTATEQSSSNIKFLEKLSRVINEPLSETSSFVTATEISNKNLEQVVKDQVEDSCLEFMHHFGNRTSLNLNDIHQTLVENTVISGDSFEKRNCSFNKIGKIEEESFEEEQLNENSVISISDDSLIVLEESSDYEQEELQVSSKEKWINKSESETLPQEESELHELTESVKDFLNIQSKDSDRVRIFNINQLSKISEKTEYTTCNEYSSIEKNITPRIRINSMSFNEDSEEELIGVEESVICETNTSVVSENSDSSLPKSQCAEEVILDHHLDESRNLEDSFMSTCEAQDTNSLNKSSHERRGLWRTSSEKANHSEEYQLSPFKTQNTINSKISSVKSPSMAKGLMRNKGQNLDASPGSQPKMKSPSITHVQRIKQIQEEANTSGDSFMSPLELECTSFNLIYASKSPSVAKPTRVHELQVETSPDDFLMSPLELQNTSFSETKEGLKVNQFQDEFNTSQESFMSPLELQSNNYLDKKGEKFTYPSKSQGLNESKVEVNTENFSISSNEYQTTYYSDKNSEILVSKSPLLIRESNVDTNLQVEEKTDDSIISQLEANESCEFDDTLEEMNRFLAFGEKYKMPERSPAKLTPQKQESNSKSNILVQKNTPSDKLLSANSAEKCKKFFSAEKITKPTIDVKDSKTTVKYRQHFESKIKPPSVNAKNLFSKTTEKPCDGAFKIPKKPCKKTTPSKALNPHLKHVVSPVSVYINNSPKYSPLVKAHSSKTLQKLPVSVPIAVKENIPDILNQEIPPVFYKPAKIKQVSVENEVILPGSIKKLIREPIVTKHERRIARNPCDTSIERKLMESDLSIDSSVLNQDISVITQKQGLNLK